MVITRKAVKAYLGVFVVSLFIVAPVMAQDVLEAVPADALFAVRVNNFEYTLGQLDLFLVGLAPAPNMASMMGRMQLANALGDPNLSNVNLRGQMAVFGMAMNGTPSAKPQMSVSILIPVTDYKKFISSNPSATQPDANGIGTIGQMKMLVTQAGDYAILTMPDKYTALGAAVNAAKTKNLASAFTAVQRESSAKARIWAYGNVGQAMNLYNSEITAGMEQAKTAMAAKDPNMAKMSQFMSIYMDTIKCLMKETKDITITANPKADGLGLSVGFTAIPGTETAKMLTASQADKSPNNLLGYLSDNAMMNMAGKLDKPLIIKMYAKLLDIVAPVLGPKFTPEEKAKVNDLIVATVNSLGGSFVSSVVGEPNSTPPFSGTKVFEVADADALWKNENAWVELINAPYMQDLFDRFDLHISCELKQDAEKYNGVAIQQGEIAILPTDPNAVMAQMISKMYGENFICKTAIVNGLGLEIVGPNADARIKSLIDKVKAGQPAAINAEFKNAIAQIPDSNEAQFIGTYNYLRALQMAANFMPAAPFDANAASALQKATSKSNGIVFSANIGDGTAAVNFALPKQHILEIKSAFETFMPKNHRPCN